MNLRDLKYLVALADHRHFGRAAAACFVSQPTLSTQIRKLEDELGVTLVERSPRKIMLTPTGQQVAERARRIVGDVEQMKEVARRSQDPEAGVVRLGLFPTLGPYLLPHVVPSIRRRFQQLELLLIEDKSDQLLARLRTLCEGFAAMSGCTIDLQLPHYCPPCVNAQEQAALAAAAMGEVLGADNVKTDLRAFPFSDDFSYMLERWPGAYLFLGMESAMCHHPTYRFDDNLLPVAAAVFDRIVRKRLG